MDADEFFTARDEMNAKVHLAEARWSPRSAGGFHDRAAWQAWKYPDLPGGPDA
jgi:hypothetical protein